MARLQHSVGLLWLLLLLLISTSAAAASHSGKVNWIYDGDTIRVEGIGKVRLIGIDTPEKNDSSRDNYYLRHHQLKRSTLRDIALKAFNFNMQQVRDRTVSLSFDHERLDKYGRTLAYVTLPDGRMLNRVLLEKGLAAVYRRFDFRHKQEFLQIEKSARDRKLGLWHR